MDPAAMKQDKKIAGFTLVEIIVSIVLLGMVLTMSGMFLNFSFNSERKVEKEYDLQTEVRRASSTVNEAIRDASVTFLIPQDVFLGSKKENWSYLGLESNKQVVQYTWNPETKTHDKKTILTSRDDVLYSLFFSKVQQEGKLVKFDLNVIDEEGDKKTFDVSSELEALNSVAVDEGGSESDPAVAIAYRSDPAPIPEEVTTQREVTIAISLVLDDSGSMDWDMNGRSNDDWGFDRNNIRKDIMKRRAAALIDQFAGIGNIQVSVIPFATTANNPSEMLYATDNKTAMKTKINGLNASGGTNTGDGLRRAYYQLEKYNNDHPTDEIVNYIILLTDGDPTFFSGDNTKEYYSWGRWYDRSYSDYLPKLGPGDCGEDYVWGAGNNSGSDGATNLQRSMTYCKSVADNKILLNSALNINTFFIGFSAVPTDIANNRTVAENYCQGRYYEAAGEVELEQTFEEITQTILQETWHIYGPY